MKILIIGGVAGGASAATRARRMNANAEITILEKGPVVSFANCGLPYHIGGEIAERKKLIVATEELFWNRFRVTVKTHQEAIQIDRIHKRVTVLDHSNSTTNDLEYDRLIISTGSKPIVPSFCEPMPSNAFHLWTLADMDRILASIRDSKPQRAVVVGGGFVGLETVEQLHRLGIGVTLIERNPQILKPLDIEMARIVQNHMMDKGVQMCLNTSDPMLVRSNSIATGLRFKIDGQEQEVPLDLLIVGAGILPRTELAEEAGLAIGSNGGVAVNRFMQTSDPDIYAVGDIVELHHGVFSQSMRIPLAGPANRAGRIAGQHAATGHADPMGDCLGTSIVRIFDKTAGCTGANEKTLREHKILYRSVIIQAAHHASYFPGAQSMELKLLYAPGDGKILGAQAVGGEGVDKRIDIVATAIHFGGTVRQLAQLDLAYAPPYGSAKDPIHQAAFTASNDLDHTPSVVPPDADLIGKQVVDVRTAKEQSQLPLAGAIAIEIDQLADRWTELDPNLPTVVVCHSAKRAHVGACFLQGKGFTDVSNLTGGMAIRKLLSGSI